MINYCSNCGNKVQQAGANFCPKCGQNLKKVEKNFSYNVEAESQEEETSYKSVNFENIKNNIKIYAETENAKKITVGEYLEANKNNQSSEDNKIKRSHCNLPDGKDLLKLVQKECSTSRDKSSEIE